MIHTSLTHKKNTFDIHDARKDNNDIPPHTDSQFRFEGLRMLGLLLLSAIVMVVTLRAALVKQETRSKAAVSGPMIAVLPSRTTVRKGQNAALAVSLATGTDKVAAIAIEIPYDTRVLDTVSFVPSSLFPVILSAPMVVQGVLRVTLGVLPGHSYTGTGIVGTLYVRGASNAQTTLGFSDATAVASIGKRTNAVVSKTSATVLVTGTPVSGDTYGIPVSPTYATTGVAPQKVASLGSTPGMKNISSGRSESESTPLTADETMDTSDTSISQDYSPFGERAATEDSGVFTPLILFFQGIWSVITSLF